MHPESAERVCSAGEIDSLRAFLRSAIPPLADARLASTRVCVYCDTWDQHFWIAPDPARRGLVVAAGGSGHAFKFAPILGDLIADAVEGNVVARFRWREDGRHCTGEERARHQG
jgi:glycine/D-amino acid oxidase-like deaminating enzyme